jgi:glycosyltransferase involved in cell wall biosynthesis
MISIICPCFNSGDTIDGVIKSLLTQVNTKYKYEVIFIDDGSKDNTINLIKKGIKQLDSKGIASKIHINTHKGPGAARNIGINISNYDYIAFIDSDDIWYKNKLSICEEMILKYPKYNLFVHDEKYIRKNRNDSIIVNGVTKEPLESSLYNKNSLSTSAIILKKDLIDQYGGFDEKLMSSQDYELWLRLSPYIKIFKINEILGEYRETLNSITSKFYLYRMFDQLVIAYRYRRYVSLLEFYTKIIKIIFSKQWIYGIRNIVLRRKSHNY